MLRLHLHIFKVRLILFNPCLLHLVPVTGNIAKLGPGFLVVNEVEGM